MRILCVIDSLGRGGAQRQLVTLGCGLKARAHHVEFFVYHPSYLDLAPELEQQNIPIHTFHKKSRFSVSVVMNLRRVIKENHYDVVLAFQNIPGIYAVLSKVRLKGVRLVVSERTTYPSGTPSMGLRIVSQAHRWADHVTANSHYHRERLISVFPWIRDKVSTILNGVDLDRFSPSCSGNPPRPSDRLSLLVVANNYWYKNPVGLVHALNRYQERFGMVPHLYWAGRFDFPGSELNKVTPLLDKYGLQNAWTWLGERTDIPDLMRAHDAIVLASVYEGSPNALCEAMACGRPVLASRVCDHPFLIEGRGVGMLFDPEDPDNMAQVLHDFATLTPKERQIMGKRARTFAEETLSSKTYVEKYESLFRQLTLESDKDVSASAIVNKTEP